MEFFELGKNFGSVADVKDHVKEYERTHLINLYIQDFRRLESTRKMAPKRCFSDELEFSELTYAYIHGGLSRKSTSTGKRPIQRLGYVHTSDSFAGTAKLHISLTGNLRLIFHRLAFSVKFLAIW